MSTSLSSNDGGERHRRGREEPLAPVGTRSDHIDTGAWDPLLYVFRDYFGTGSLLGHTHRR